jgi:hypothetical protein
MGTPNYHIADRPVTIPHTQPLRSLEGIDRNPDGDDECIYAALTAQSGRWIRQWGDEHRVALKPIAKTAGPFLALRGPTSSNIL